MVWGHITSHSLTANTHSHTQAESALHHLTGDRNQTVPQLSEQSSVMLRIPQIPKCSGLVPQYRGSRWGDLTAEESAIKLSKWVHIMLMKSRRGKRKLVHIWKACGEKSCQHIANSPRKEEKTPARLSDLLKWRKWKAFNNSECICCLLMTVLCY